MNPLSAEDIELILEFLSADEPERKLIAANLRTLLARQQMHAPHSRQAIPCRRPLGLYVLLPWRWVNWLAAALELSPDELQWLRDETKTPCRASNIPGLKRPEMSALPRIERGNHD